MSNKIKPGRRRVIENSEDSSPCKRSYRLERRLEKSDSTRSAILRAAKLRLERNGYQDVTMESLASDTGVTRQTVHNLFGTKSQLIEALFDEIAVEAGMNRMGEIMRLSDPRSMMREFVTAITSFWASQRLLIRRIHGIAAVDPEFGKAVESRDRRRQMAAARIVGVFATKAEKDSDAQTRAKKVATLYALTSFEFFDALAETSPDPDVSGQLLALVEKCMIT